MTVPGSPCHGVAPEVVETELQDSRSLFPISMIIMNMVYTLVVSLSSSRSKRRVVKATERKAYSRR